MPENQTKDLPFSPSEGKDFMFEPTVVLDGEIVHGLQSAINEKKSVKIEHWIYNNKKYELLTLNPLYVFYERHGYYLLAFEKEAGSRPGIYSINRMNRFCQTNDVFKIPKDFNIKDYLKKETDIFPKDNKIYKFELSFPKEVASEAIEKVYYNNQEIKLCDDGTVFLRFRSTRLYEVFHWVLGQGHKVKALEPPELLTMMKKEIQKLAKYYI
jgi:predicted DNA-binding transcriptional regulator YafY